MNKQCVEMCVELLAQKKVRYPFVGVDCAADVERTEDSEKLRIIYSYSSLSKRRT